MDDESSVKLLLNFDNRKTDTKTKRFHQNRSANALFFGVVLGFVFSFLFAYSGIVNESNNINYSIYDFTSRNVNTSLEPPETTNLAEFLRAEVRVLCVVMTSSGAVKERAKIIMDTWGKRCNKLLFFSDEPDETYDNVVSLPAGDKFERLREAFKHVYTNYINEFDWVLRTNDHSFIVLENLRHMLYQYDTDWPVVIGQRFLKEVLPKKIFHLFTLFTRPTSKDYMIGDFALSKRAFTRLLEDAFTNTEICAVKGDDDKETAKCLEHVNVIKVDGIDEHGRGRFFANNPESALFPVKFDDYDKWYWNKLKQGIDNCCSDRLILIQNSYNTHLYYLEYFIYKVHAFGRHRNREPLPPKLSLEEIVKTNY